MPAPSRLAPLPLPRRIVPTAPELRYRLEAPLSSSGARQVWRATDRLFSRTVVLKGVLAAEGEPPLEEVVRELELLHRCRHPQLVLPYELGTLPPAPDCFLSPHPFFFFSQEYLPGPSLQEAIARDQVPPDQLLPLFRQLLETTAFLHRLGIVRLDLKSQHLLRGSRGWCLIDLEQARPDNPLRRDPLSGTRPYMAPELFQHLAGSVRTDLYALGVLLHELLTGRLPDLPVAGPGQSLADALRQSLPPRLDPALAEAHPALARLVPHLLARAPEDRPASIAETLSLLDDGHKPATRFFPLPVLPCVFRSDLLSSLLSWAASDAAGVAILEGPPGSGHSRLLESFLLHAQAHGLPALLLTRADVEDDPSALLRAVVCHLRSFLLEPDRDIPATPDLPNPEEAPLEPSALLQIIAALAEALIRTRPGLRIPLLLDDWHHLPAPAREGLERLITLFPTGPLRLVFPRGPGGPDPTDIPPEQPGNFRHLPALCLNLRPLDLDALRSLVEGIFPPGTLDAGELVGLLEHTGGLPRACAQALELCWQRGPGSWRDWRPEGLEAHLESRLEGRDPAVIRAALGSSILRGAFSGALLEWVIEQPVSGFASEHLVALGWWQALPEHPTGPRFRFVQDGARQALHARLSLELRHRFLLRAVAAGELLDADSARSRSLSGLYALEAGALESAWERLEPLLLAPPPAPLRDWLLDALGALPSDGPPELHASLMLLRGRLELDLDRAGAAERSLEQIRTAHLAHPERPLLSVTQLARLHALLGKALSRQGQHELAATRLSEALRLCRDPIAAISSLEVIACLHQRALCLQQSGDLPGCRDALQQAAALGVPLQSSLGVDQIQSEAALAMRLGPPDPHFFTSLEFALQLSRALAYPAGEIRVLNSLVAGHRARQDLKEAIRIQRQVVTLCRQRLDLPREATGLLNLGLLLMEQEALQQALEALRDSESVSRAIGERGLLANALLNQLELLIRRGAEADALQVKARLETLLVLLPPRAILTLTFDLLSLRLQILQEPGMPDQDARLQELQQQAALLSHRRLELECLADRLEVLLHNGQAGQGIPLLLRMEQLLGDMPTSQQSDALTRRLRSLASRVHQVLSGTTSTRAAPAKLAGEADPPSHPPRHADSPSSRSDGPHAPAARVLLPQNSSRDATISDVRSTESPPTLPVGQDADVAPLPALPPPSARREPPGSGESGRRLEPTEARQPATPGGEASDDHLLDQLQRELLQRDESEVFAASLVNFVGKLLNAEALVLLARDDDEFDVLRGFTQDGTPAATVSRHILRQVRKSRRPLILGDIVEETRFGDSETVRAAGLRSVLCYPVLDEQDRLLGVIYAGHPQPGALLHASARAMMQHLVELTRGLLSALSFRRHPLPQIADSFGLIGDSPAMQRLREQLQDLLEADLDRVCVMLLGETGVGKNLVASLLNHHLTGNARKLIGVNCAAIPTELLEGELFGTASGAFTGATDRKGLLAMANGGTLFLDEVVELKSHHQAKLLSALHPPFEYRRVGDERVQHFTGHVISATNESMGKRIAEGLFRFDLYQRLAVEEIVIPPLRERGSRDIQLLALDLLRKTLQSLNMSSSPDLDLKEYFSDGAVAELCRYEWPGNVRELGSVFSRARVRKRLKTGGKSRVTTQDIEQVLKQGRTVTRGMNGSGLVRRPPPGAVFATVSGWADLEVARHIYKVYLQKGEDKKATALALETTRDTVYRYLRKLSDEDQARIRQED